MATKVRALTKDGDFTFGNGKSNYVDDDNGIIQNVKTRLKSLKYDFFLDVEANIDWFGILGQIKNRNTIVNEIYRVTFATDGVVEINSIEVVDADKRNATISLNFATINTNRIQLELGLL